MSLQNLEDEMNHIVDQSDIQNDLMDSITLLKSKKFNNAKKILRSILKKESNNPIAVQLLNFILKTQNRIEEADEILEKALSIHQDFYQKILIWSDKKLDADETNQILLYLYGLGLIEVNKQYRQAIDIFDKILQIDPKLVMAHILKGYALKHQGKNNLSFECYQRSVEVGPNCAFARYSLGCALLDKNQEEKAIVSFDEAIILSPNFKQAYYEKGITLFKIDRIEEGLSTFQEALLMKPQKKEFYQKIYVFLNKSKQYLQAFIFSNQYLELFPDDLQIQKNQISCLINLQDYEKALQVNQWAIETHPFYFELIYQQGCILHDMQRYEDAIHMFDLFMMRNEDDSLDAHFKKGLSLLKLQNLGSAFKEFQFVIQQNNNYLKAYEQITKCLFQLQQYDQALFYSEQYLDLYQADYEMINFQGECYFQQAIELNKENREQIKQLLNQARKRSIYAININENYSQAYLLQGQVLKKLGHKKKAIMMFQKSIQTDPHMHQSYRILSFHIFQISLGTILDDKRQAIFHLRLAQINGAEQNLNNQKQSLQLKI